MAVKIFGTCSGASGSKYSVWLEATQNSQNLKNNTSNVTLKLKVKRNDGVKESAYNLNENENYAKITVKTPKK